VILKPKTLKRLRSPWRLGQSRAASPDFRAKAGKANSRKKKFYEKQKQEEKVEEKQK
jgi:hypothetical protein